MTTHSTLSAPHASTAALTPFTSVTTASPCGGSIAKKRAAQRRRTPAWARVADVFVFRCRFFRFFVFIFYFSSFSGFGLGLRFRSFVLSLWFAFAASLKNKNVFVSLLIVSSDEDKCHEERTWRTHGCTLRASRVARYHNPCDAQQKLPVDHETASIERTPTLR